MTTEEIGLIVREVPGGAANVQDIYPLAPLQEGILFHHMMGGKGDPYLLASLFSFDNRERLESHLGALRAVIARHDILRTAVVWEGLPQPVQVVWRRAEMPVEEIELDAAAGDAAQQLFARFNPRQFRIDVRRAPLLRICIARDTARDRWLMMLLLHHLAGDHSTLEVMQEEIQAHLLGRADKLPAPQPFRNLVAQARLGISQEEHEAFFRKLVGDVNESTAPFGLLNVRGDGTGIEEAGKILQSDLTRRLRGQARRAGVSAASVCHVAWAQVLARVSGREDVVFGTVLFGRVQGGAGSDRVMGLFINTLPVRIHVGEQGAAVTVRQTHALLGELLRHEHAPLALAQRCSGVPAPAPLFSSLLNYRHSPRAGQAPSEDGMQGLYAEERTNYPLALSVDDLGEGLMLRAQVQASIEPARVCEYMHTALESLVEALEGEPGRAVGSLEVLPEEERDQVLQGWNETQAEYPDQACVHELFETQVTRTPDADAVVCEEASLSYAELNARANRLAHYLRELGVKPDARVAICLDRGFGMIVALLAVLKAGGAYVPLDPAYPVERLQYMVDDSAPVALLTQGHLQSLFSGPVLDLRAGEALWKDQPETNPERAGIGLTPQHLAYVIYTSGSTGQPKGVMVEHRGLCNLVAAQIRGFAVKPDSRVLQFASFSFDACVSEIFVTLCEGASLWLPGPGEKLIGEELIRSVRDGGITHATLPPAVLAGLPGQAGLESIRVLVTAGDVLTEEVAERWSGGRRLINAYGPTEATVCAAMHDCRPEDAGRPPIGRPIANTRIYILDARQQPAPVGVAGELYIGGAGVARGYLNHAELTAERFLPDPFVTDREARMYRTGDLGRWLRDGTIEFLGRNDFQVKIRGYRIELGEIEARLTEYAGVREAVVIAREDRPDDKRLVAYYTDDGRETSAEQLRGHLSATVPEYMVPAAYVRLESLPLTPNGKLDRRALPAPEMDAHAVRGYEAPVGEIEETLAAIWADLLKLDRVGRHDNFFELGGHSLLAVRVATRLRQALSVEVALGDLFAHPVLSDFARRVERATRPTLPPIACANRDIALPLSFAQQRLWFLAQMEGVSKAYHISFGLRLMGGLNDTALRQALDRIMQRHEALRTTFAFTDGEPVQRIAPVADSWFHLFEHDLRQSPDAARELHSLTAEEAGTPFDLEAGPLIRGRLMRLGEDEHALLITMHHIVSDGWSMEVLIRELSALYEAFAQGHDDPLAPLSVQYADYAVWQRRWIEGEVLRQQADYWKGALAGAPELLELAADHVRPSKQDFSGAFAGLVLDEGLTAALRNLSRRHGATLFMTLLAGWAALLTRLSGQLDVVVGTPVANRGRAEIEGLIGFFVNTLALRLDASGSPTVGELIEQVKAKTIAAQQHQDIPFEQVVELARAARSLAHTPLFQVMFNWQNASRNKLELRGLEVLPLGAALHPVAKFDLTLNLQEAGDRIVGGLEYATSLFEPATAERYLGYLRRLLEGMVSGDSQTVASLPLLAEEERQQVLYGWNQTQMEYPDQACVHELFEAQAARTPNAPAVVHEGATLSYAELNTRANRLAHYLRELGVKPDSRVVIRLDRGFEIVVALLGVLKAGGAYVPLDPLSPPERVDYMLKESAPVTLLDERTGEALWKDQPETNPERGSTGLTSRHLASVLYTSGSTGAPKGVMLEHRGINRLVINNRYAKFDATDRLAFACNPAFDAITLEVWPALVNGGCIVVIDQADLLEPGRFGEALKRNAVSAMWITVGLFNEYADALATEFANLRYLMTGGDVLNPGVISRVLRHKPKHLINGYGPTETTTFATTYEITTVPEDGRSIPIGRPIGNTQVYILDVQRQPVPVGVGGELYIGGAGVARGYLNRPELTAERFIEDPFVAGERMYRTGDLGRWLPEGTIEFLGRNDFQVKIRGFRIELGEIEARLAEHAGVREAVVLAREDTPGDKQLVAYYTDTSQSPTAEQLRAWLSGKLPAYMLPAAYVRLEKLPLTPNGKLDRRALPAPEADACAVRAYEAPVGEMEPAVARIWAEVLKLDRVGRQDHFFDLGGHSLLAVRVITRLRQALGVEVALTDLFAHPVLSDLARSLENAARSALPQITRTDREQKIPLSFAQQRLWFLAQMEGANDAYHIPVGLRLIGALDTAALGQALDRIVERHEVLRTTFAFVDGEPVQRIVSVVDCRFHLLNHDLRQSHEAESELDRRLAEEARTPFDLGAGPLIRGRLLRLGESEHALLITMHHIVSDGWSMQVMIQELSALYGAFAQGQTDPLPPLDLQYADYAVWQRRWIEGDILRQQAEYWKTTLGGAPELLELPVDHPRPEQQDHRGATTGLVLDENLTAALRDFCRRRGVTLFMTLLAGWAALLARLSGQPEVVIGTPAENRGRMEIEGLIGFFVNTLVLRLDLSESPTVSELLERVKAQTIAAQQHQDIPFEQVVELARPVRSLSHSPLFQVMFSWQNTSASTIDLPGVEVRPLRSAPHVAAKFDLNLSLQETGDRIVGGLEYATSLFEPATVTRYLGYFRCLLEAMVHGDSQAVDSLPLLPESERHQVLYKWNQTQAAYPEQSCVHELFEAQVTRTPEAAAVVFEDESLSYAELNARANRLAHYLRGLGVKPDTRVAICLERGFEMVVALLAVLKAGGAYVPLDPAYPVERLNYMLEDSAAVALLTQGHLRGLFSGHVLDLGAAAPPWKDQPETNPERTSIGLTPEHLAYVIYTSGSTGAPKGVMVEHRQLSNYAAAIWDKLHLSEGCSFGLVSTFAADLGNTVIFSSLLRGGTLHVLSQSDTTSADRFGSYCRKHPIDCLKITPSHFQALLSGAGESHRIPRRRLVFGGEALSKQLVAAVAALQPECRIYNHYGPTECTVGALSEDVTESNEFSLNGSAPLGRPMRNMRIYVLDTHRQPVPAGVTGELYIGGAGVTRGYLNQKDLTAQRFLPDPFVADKVDGCPRMYRTGDLGRWLPDGTVEFLGRNDFQVKVRGFRIELGEIEARLTEHTGVRDAVVIAREDTPGDRRLVAYYTGTDQPATAEQLRAHLSAKLPEYMLPGGYVRLESLPLTPNGKLDRKALPGPEADAYALRGYEAPAGETEEALAVIWAGLLKLDRVGRHDNFFELGGHSLLAVTLIERMRQAGLLADVRALFATPTLSDLAAATGLRERIVEVPPNLIPEYCEAITPEMLPLVELTLEQIGHISGVVAGGARNVQDIYPLAPLQEGILFHHLMGGDGDPYLGALLLGFESRSRLENYVEALQSVIARHDILRTAVQWEGLTQPVQVVWRRAVLAVEELELDAAAGDLARQLYARFDPRQFRIDVSQAPLLRLYIAHDAARDRWLMMQLQHHLVGDHSTLEVMREEIQAHLLGEADRLPPAQPFRDLVAQARLGISREEHEAFFRKLLGDVEEPTAPFGLLDVRGDGTGIEEAARMVDPDLARRLREQARRLGVSAASVCHLAWAQVLARLSGREDVVFGTVLFGRMRGGASSDRVMGLFINTLPVRIRIGEQGTEASVRRTHAQLGDLLRHEHASLALAQRCSAVPAPTPLFSALLNYRHSAGAARTPSQEATRAWDGIRGLHEEERTNYPFMLSVDDLGEGLIVRAQVQASATAIRVCEYMETALASLVGALESEPGRGVGTLEVLPEEERGQVLYGWNQTQMEYPEQACLHELFEAQAARTPGVPAVVCGEASLSYAELNARANRLAHYLRELGVKPDARVAICLERGFEMIVALLAVLKAGGAYVPLDPAYPAERRRYMLEDSTPVALLTGGPGRLLPGLDLEGDAALWKDQPETNPVRALTGVTPEHLAYIIYTSGSTGEPKGVAIEHRNAVNFIRWAQDSFTPDVLAQTLFSTSLNFDLAVYECFVPITAGATVRIVRDALELARTPVSVTLINTVPSAMNALLEAAAVPNSVRHVNLAGEPLKAALVERIFANTEVAAVCNLYGPSETTTYSTWVSMRRGEPFAPHIGRPVANTRIYILDARQRPAPVGVAGELYIGGAGVARGYLNRPELTAERFLADPFVTGGRMYKTGDLGRWRSDGNIEFLGRNDFQVKIRGFRIELGEIEARLTEHAGIREAVVIAREDTAGDKRLVGYYTTNTDESVSVDELRTQLALKLPEYMVPAAFVRLDELPLTPNGKLDRKALPAPESDAYAVRGYEAPIGETETAVAAIWAEVLKVEQVGRHDNFFELGGHSLLAVAVVERMRRAGLHLDVRALFATPILSELAAAVSLRETAVVVPPNGIPAQCDTITPEMLPLVKLTAEEIAGITEQVPGGAANIQDIYPLAPLQEGILFHHLMGGEGDPYLLVAELSFDRRERLESYISALRSVIGRHDILRTAVLWEGLSEPVQVVWRKAELLVEEVELGDGDAAQKLHARFNPRQFRIDVRQAPLLRIYIGYDAAQDRWLMMQLLHHLAGDHSTLEVMQEEIQAHLMGRPDRLPVVQPFRNLVAQARLGISREEHEAFFRKLLGDVEEPTAPFGLLDVRGDGTGIEEARKIVEADLARRIREQARRLGVSAASVCHVAWAQVLARASGRDDVVFGTVLFGRMQGVAGADRVMGLFINTLPVRIRIGEEGAEASVRHTHAQLGDLLRHEHASLALAQRCSAVPASTPLFSALLNYRHSSRAAQAPSAEQVQVWKGIRGLYGEERTNYPFTLAVDDRGEGFRLTARVKASIEPMRVCEQMHMALESLVVALERELSTTVRSLEVLPEKERQQLLYGWNETQGEYPDQACIHELFEAQVACTPDAPAVVFEDASLSYAELNARANRLAHYLLKLGVKPDARVAVCLERGFEMVVALLAVLKAGGAYVPLDPTYPVERLHYMLEDSAPVALLTQGHLPGLFSGPVLDLRTGEALWQDQPETNPERHSMGLTAGHLAYVIYTSGSTGTPKGAMVEHRGLCNRIVWMQNAYGLGPHDAVLQKTPFTFDVSVWEFFWPLLVGARLVMARPEGHKDPGYLGEAIRRNRITTIHFVPSMLQAFLEYGGETEHSPLVRVICSGEALPVMLARRFQERLPEATLHNLYGPTEATVDVTAWTCGAKLEGASIPIGRPIANTRIYILDGQRQPAPKGVTGELYIAGVQVARGYLNQPELTAERFLADPFVRNAFNGDGRMYRTGDLARWLPDGNIEFLGRNDFQVKIRGFRIELGEIEARLAEQGGVREAVVVAREDTAGDKRLVAYYTCGEDAPAVEQLRTGLLAKLPEYMVPAAYVRLEKLPLTANGKLDRKALPAPDFIPTTSYRVPETPLQVWLAELWRKVLGRPAIGLDDDFFEIGGDSIRAVALTNQIQARLRETVHVAAVFEAPTIGKLSALLRGSYPVAVAGLDERREEATRAKAPSRISLKDLTKMREAIAAQNRFERNNA